MMTEQNIYTFLDPEARQSGKTIAVSRAFADSVYDQLRQLRDEDAENDMTIFPRFIDVLQKHGVQKHGIIDTIASQALCAENPASYKKPGNTDKDLARKVIKVLAGVSETETRDYGLRQPVTVDRDFLERIGMHLR